MRGRTILAFLVAPLAVPAAHCLLSLIPFMADPGVLAASPDVVDGILGKAAVFAVAAYAGMLLMGPPIAWLAARQGVTGFGASCAWGATAGAVAGVGAGWVIRVVLDPSLGAASADLADMVMPFVVLATAGGVAGGLVGALYWSIARPDLAGPDGIGVEAAGQDLPGLAPLAMGGAGISFSANDLEDRKAAG